MSEGEKTTEQQKKERSRLQRFLEAIERLANQGKIVWQHRLTRQFRTWLWQHRRNAIVVLTCLIVLTLGIYTIFDSIKTPAEALNTFHDALLSEDVQSLQGIVEPDDSQLTFKEKQAKDLIQFSQQDENYFFGHDGLFAHLQKKQQQISDTVYADPPLTNMADHYYLKKKKWLFWDSYYIGVRSAYLKVTTNVTGAQVWVDRQPVKMVGNQGTIGPLLPGIYELKGSKQYPFAVVTQIQKAHLFRTAQRTMHERLNISGGSIRVSSSLPNTEIVVNGKKSGQKIGQTITDFGPVSANGSLQIYGERSFAWGLLKSTPIVIKENVWKFDLTPNPFTDERVKKELIDVINRYAQERVKANKERSATPYTTIDEQLKSEQAEEFTERKQFRKDDRYQGEAIKTTISIKKAKMTEEERTGVVKMKIPVQFHYRERTYGYFDRGDEPLEDEYEDAYVWLIYDEKMKRWLITELNSILHVEDMFRDPTAVVTQF